jgi:hypothetical protein
MIYAKLQYNNILHIIYYIALAVRHVLQTHNATALLALRDTNFS